MKPMRIIITPPFSWKKRGAIFLGIFGGLWTLVESSSAFGLTQNFLASSGILGYGVLFISSLLPTLWVEYSARWKTRSKISFINRTILLTKSGTEHSVEAPRSMRVEQLLEIFVTRVQVNALIITVAAYELSLSVFRIGRYEKIESSSTVRDAGLKNQDLCKITGEIIPRYQAITLHADNLHSWPNIAKKIEIRYKIMDVAIGMSRNLIGKREMR